MTKEDLKKLDRAIASGVLQVQYDDHTIRYRSMDEMMRARQMMARELGIARKPRRATPAFGKGV